MWHDLGGGLGGNRKSKRAATAIKYGIMGRVATILVDKQKEANQIHSFQLAMPVRINDELHFCVVAVAGAD